MIKFLTFYKSYVFKYKYDITLASITIFILSILILPIPFLTRHIFDKVIPNKELDTLIYIISICFIVLILQKFLDFFQAYIFYKVNLRIIFRIKIDLLRKVNLMDFLKFQKNGIGYYISRINEDTKRIRTLFADTLALFIRDILTFLTGVSAILYLNTKLALIVIVLLPIYLYVLHFFKKKIKESSSIHFENVAKALEKLEESLSIIKIIKSFSRYNFNIIRYSKVSRISLESNINLGFITFLNLLFSGFLVGLPSVLVLGVGSYLVINGQFSIGSMLAFSSFTGYILTPANRIISLTNNFSQALIALDRINSILLSESKEGAIRVPFKENITHIRISNLNFKYSNESILENLSLSIDTGQKIAIVGYSGCGKTTLLQIIAGILSKYSCNIECISEGNTFTYKNDFTFFKKHLSYVEQEPILFADTIINNIRFGNSKATTEEVIEVCQSLKIDNFISDLPEGYSTFVGTKGSRLSIGQKQRIAIARALIRKPKLLLLDEATSNIDSKNEKYILDYISSLENTKVIIITHKLEIIQNCNKIYVLDKAKFIESGSHNELLKNKGIYYELTHSKLYK